MTLPAHVKACLPPLLQDTLKNLEIVSGAPDQLTLPVLLSVVNFASMAHKDVVCPVFPDNGGQQLNEFFAVIADSGVGKSRLQKMLWKGVSDYNKEYKIEYRKLKTEWDNSMLAYKRDRIKDPTLVPDPKPRSHRTVFSKATLNALIDIARDSPYFALVNADGAEFLNSHAFQNKNRGGDTEIITVISKFYSNEEIGRLTGIEENNVTTEERRMALLLMVQGAFAKDLTNKKYQSQGFVPRLLFTQCPRFKKLRAPRDQAEKDARAKATVGLLKFHRRIKQLVEEVPTVMANSRAKMTTEQRMWGDPNELYLDKICFNDKDNGAKLAADFYDEMEDVIEADETPEDLMSYFSRQYDHVLRLAGTFAVFEDTDVVLERHVLAAIGIVRWFMEERFKVNLDVELDMPVDVVVEMSKKVLKWMKKYAAGIDKATGKPRGPVIAWSDILAGPGNDDWRLRMKVDKKKEVMAEMVQNGWIEHVEIDGAGYYKLLV